METKVNYAVVGLFVLVLGTALVAAVLWLASGGMMQKKYDLYQAVEDESVAGLNLNAPVKYNGVDVGKVKTISLEPGNPARTPDATRPTLLVNPPHAASGFDSQRIIYVRAAHQLEYFAHSEWIDTPARMLAPLIVSAVETRGGFRAVVLLPSAASGDLRLDTEILRLRQDFTSTPSQVRFTLRAYLEDNATRRVLATREFDASVAAASEDPYGGVVAANQAVQRVLQQLADFCAETTLRRQ